MTNSAQPEAQRALQHEIESFLQRLHHPLLVENEVALMDRTAGIDGDARPQLQKIGEIAAVHGEVRDDRALQGSAEFGVGGLHHGQRFGDGDLLGLLAGLQGQIDTQFLIDLKNYARSARRS